MTTNVLHSSATPTLVLVSGAAGSGKTTLLSGYLENANHDRPVLAYDEHHGLTRNTQAEIHSDSTDFFTRLWELLSQPEPLTIVIDGMGALHRQTEESESAYFEIESALRPGVTLIIADQKLFDWDPPLLAIQVQLRSGLSTPGDEGRWSTVTHKGETTPYSLQTLRYGQRTSLSDDLRRIISSCQNP